MIDVPVCSSCGLFLVNGWHGEWHECNEIGCMKHRREEHYEKGAWATTKFPEDYKYTEDENGELVEADLEDYDYWEHNWLYAKEDMETLLNQIAKLWQDQQGVDVRGWVIRWGRLFEVASIGRGLQTDSDSILQTISKGNGIDTLHIIFHGDHLEVWVDGYKHTIYPAVYYAVFDKDNRPFMIEGDKVCYEGDIDDLEHLVGSSFSWDEEVPDYSIHEYHIGSSINVGKRWI